MKKFLGVVLGAVVFFVWGAVSWIVIPWHASAMKKLPEEQLITDTLKTVVTERGMYFFPAHSAPGAGMDDKAWLEKFRKGPVGLMIFSPAGREPMTGSTYAIGFLIALIAAAITLTMLNLTRDRVKTIFSRALVGAAIGLAVAFTAHLNYWNWFCYPPDYTLVEMANSVIGFFLIGLVQSKFVCQD